MGTAGRGRPTTIAALRNNTSSPINAITNSTSGHIRRSTSAAAIPATAPDTSTVVVEARSTA
jgi:hypothetical protein